MHKVLPFELYDVPKLSESTHTIDLVKDKQDSTEPKIASGLSLKTVYEEYVKPGEMLYLTEAMKKGTAENYDKLKRDNIPSAFQTYALVKAGSTPVKIVNPQLGKQLGGLKVIPFSLSSPPLWVRMQLDRAYQFIAAGSPVEIRIRLKGSVTNKSEKTKPGNREIWPWMHNHFPHLRPDFIMKGMPEGTKYGVKPVSDGRHVQWVMMDGNKEITCDFTKRLFKVKQSVQAAIKRGKQGELPAAIRRDLVAAGHEAYSIRTGMPITALGERYGVDGVDSIFGKDLRTEEMAALAANKKIKTMDVNRWKVKRGFNKTILFKKRPGNENRWMNRGQKP
jgi:hypothetical protein